MAFHLAIKIGGPAGYGIFTVGALATKILKRSGLWAYSCSDYPSLIKGGHNQYMIHASDKKVYSNIKALDILVCFDKKTIDLHADEIKKGGVLVYDRSIISGLKLKRRDIKVMPVALNEIANSLGSKIYEDTIAFGAICGLINAKEEIAFDLLREKFSHDGPAHLQNNLNAFKKGFEIHNGKFKNLHLKVLKDKNRILIEGNQAISLGAIKAGCKFISAYPMTPATSIMQNLASQELTYNIIVKQAEDEISAINMAIGASFAGARSMTATSGGGFSLMAEALGMAGIAEVPLVLIEVQRSGPSTGLPTYTGQDDLRFVQYASQGEFPRIIIAPGDVEECFYETFNAFNLAEAYQVPVIILSDKELAGSEMTIERFKDSGLKINRGRLLPDNKINLSFKRYLLAKEDVSPRCLPGQPNGMHIASSYEHDETGYTSEDPEMRIMQLDKRAKKLDGLYSKVKGISVYGDSNPKIQLIIWGSTKGSCLEALKTLKELKIKARIIQVRYICPFPVKQFVRAFNKKIPSLILEQNKSGQLRGLIRENTGILIENFYGKYDARQFYPEDVVKQIRKVLKC